MSGATITYPNDKFLQQTFVEQAIRKYAQGLLIAENEVVHRDIGDAESIEWIQEKYSDAGDTMKISALPEIRDASLYPHVRFSGLEVKTAALKTYGLEIDFSERVRRNKHLVDFIDRGMRRAAFWLAQLINTQIFNDMTNSWSTTASTETNDEPWNQAATAVWSDTTNRVPLTDVMDITLLVQNTENYANELDRAYIRQDNYAELLNYLQTKENVTWSRDPATGAWTSMINGIRFIPVHKLSGIPASTALFLSRGVKPTTLFERTDPQYSKVAMRDNNGKPLPGSYHVHRYFTDEDHVSHIQIWREAYPVTDRWGRKQVGILRTL